MSHTHYVSWASGAYVSCNCPLGHDHSNEALPKEAASERT